VTSGEPSGTRTKSTIGGICSYQVDQAGQQGAIGTNAGR
jgi:hypothetical protein